MITITAKSIERIVLRDGATAVVQLAPRSAQLRVVQSASPVPVEPGQIPDPGDLVLLFETNLVL
jgi:hypothetical protein